MFQSRIAHFILILGLVYLSGCKDTEFEIVNEGSSEGGATLVATVSGKVTDTQGDPISGVSVVTLPFGRDVVLDDIGRKLITDITTDELGEYEILASTSRNVHRCSRRVGRIQSMGDRWSLCRLDCNRRDSR